MEMGGGGERGGEGERIRLLGSLFSEGNRKATSKEGICRERERIHRRKGSRLRGSLMSRDDDL